MIIKKLIFAFIFLSAIQMVKATDLPIDTLNSKDMSKPLVVYITGDGGFNDFSKLLMHQWNQNGFPVVALNAKSYFWKTKTPDVASKDVEGLINQYLSSWKRKEVILVGYSFGSDVMPFLQTRFTADLNNKVKHLVLFSPSKNTDFTIHLFYNNNGSSVPDEINKLQKPVLIIFGDKETDLPDQQIKNKQVLIVKVAGDHHYNNNIAAVINDVVKRL